jgi:hypothetical protein
MIKKFVTLVGMSVALVLPGAAYAQSGIVDQVEDLEIDPGVFEVEVQTVYAPPSDGLQEFTAIGITLEYAPVAHVVLGAELELDSATGRLKASELAVQAKFALVDPDEAPIGLGLQLGAGYSIADNAFEHDAVLIATRERNGFKAAANLALVGREGELGEFDVRYAMRAEWELSRRIALGIEAGGELASTEPRGHWIGPVVAIEAGKQDGPGIGIDLGLFAGLNANTPDLQGRATVGVGF